MENTLINKLDSVQRCVKRVQELYVSREHLATHQTEQDAMILNIQRACEATIDIANHVIRLKQLGVPQSSRDAFALLEKAALITADQSKNLQAMIGFRNIAIHEYQDLNTDIVHQIIEHRMNDLLTFAQDMLHHAN